MVTGSFKSYTNFFENNNRILLKITPIYAQDNGNDFEDGSIFPSFEDDDDGNDFEDGNIFPSFEDDEGGGDGGVKEDGGGDGGVKEDGGGDGGVKEDGGGD
ncbi:MAG TPA: hypothetical protein VFP49_03535, partial [Nitrososphaeraceae archaeon]|nr:hypothetical protein [Nitrososphaeraceae archaeon]